MINQSQPHKHLQVLAIDKGVKDMPPVNNIIIEEGQNFEKGIIYIYIIIITITTLIIIKLNQYYIFICIYLFYCIKQLFIYTHIYIYNIIII